MIKFFDMANDVVTPNFEFVDEKLQYLDDIQYLQLGRFTVCAEIFLD